VARQPRAVHADLSLFNAMGTVTWITRPLDPTVFTAPLDDTVAPSLTS
jgi:hypothetical protein